MFWRTARYARRGGHRRETMTFRADATVIESVRREISAPMVDGMGNPMTVFGIPVLLDTRLSRGQVLLSLENGKIVGGFALVGKGEAGN
jgi:hypothetical protein